MSFNTGADTYDRFMGRYSARLAPLFADLGGVQRGQRALDVGCGPGALTGELVTRLGAGAVAAVDPKEAFVIATRERHPGVDVRLAAAEELPFPDSAFDVALAQLVVHFMADPIGSLREMARVTSPGGVVVACVWDHAGGRGALSPFWTAVRQLDPGAEDESGRAGARAGHLAELFEAAGLHGVDDTELAVRVDYASFDEWWGPFTLGVGPAGEYAAGLDAVQLEELKERCRQLAPAAPFTLEAIAWAARGHT